jgi:hypothetical protein
MFFYDLPANVLEYFFGGIKIIIVVIAGHD